MTLSIKILQFLPLFITFTVSCNKFAPQALKNWFPEVWKLLHQYLDGSFWFFLFFLSFHFLEGGLIFHMGRLFFSWRVGGFISKLGASILIVCYPKKSWDEPPYTSLGETLTISWANFITVPKLMHRVHKTTLNFQTLG